MWKRFLVVTGALATSAAAHVPSAPSGVPTDPSLRQRCDVAWRYIEEVLREMGGRPVVFSEEEFFYAGMPDPATAWSAAAGRSGTVPPPPRRLVDALTADSPLRACRAIRLRLEARDIGFGRRAVRWALGGGRVYRATIVTLSLPSVSADGREAVIGRGESRRRPGGGAGLVHLVRDDEGDWRVAAQIGLYVS